MDSTAQNTIQFHLNGDPIAATGNPGRLLLDYLRRDLRAVGTKEGCREGDCGACEVIYRAVPSCMLLLGHIRGGHVVTIEGLRTGPGLNLIQQAVVDQGGSQCGFCTPGFIVSFTGFVLNGTEFTVEEATHAISGNLCRCTGYVSLVRAAQDMIAGLPTLPAPGLKRNRALVAASVLPAFFGKEFGAAESANELQDSVTANAWLGGGTDLIVQRGEAFNNESPQFARSLRHTARIRVEEGELCLPGETTFEELRECTLLDEHWPTSRVDLERFASPIIRERASLAGNIANASPIADGTAIFLGLGADVVLVGATGTRRVALSEFFHGYKQIELKPGERIASLRLPKADPGHRFHFGKISKREFLDIASINSAMGITVQSGVIQSARIAAGGVAPIPLVLRQTAGALAGKPLNAQTVLDALPALDAEIAPISDVRGSAEYKRLGLRQLFFAHFLDLFPGEVDESALLEFSR
ncbi:UNVERIFIED_CONTAM: hypothetical protein GTU68_041181 [Idotea baltica]|nr:hypothetical protein [Idotea baltica]